MVLGLASSHYVHRRGVEWRGLKGVRGVTEADVTAPTDPVSTGSAIRLCHG